MRILQDNFILLLKCTRKSIFLLGVESKNDGGEPVATMLYSSYI